MELGQIYVGLKVRILGYEGIWEIIKLDDYNYSIWCNRIDSINHDLREFNINQLQRL